MTWALKRQIFYVIVLVIFISVFGFLIISPYFQTPPTCTDGTQNGNEVGVDCGGSCLLACVDTLDSIAILWSRAFRVVDSRYNAVAYLENHNTTAAINKIKYRFRFADANNIYIGKREGEAFIPPGSKFAIFEPAIDIGNSIPVYTTFEFSEVPVWVQIVDVRLKQLNISVSKITLMGEDTSPILSATIKNNSILIIPDVNVVAILYDAKGNAIAASRTYLNQLKMEESKDINFTWPEPFSSPVVTKEIIPIYNVFSMKVR